MPSAPSKSVAGPALTISEEFLRASVAARVAEVFTAEHMAAMAQAEVHRRIGLLTLDDAAKLLRCPSRAALIAFCRTARIKVTRFSHKKQFVAVSEIEAAIARKSVVPPEPGVDASRTVIAGRFRKAA